MNQAALRARMLMGQSRWELAQAELCRALADDSQNSELHSLLAICLSRAKDFERAEAEARTGVGLAPDSAASHHTLAMVLADRHKYAAAAAVAEQAIALDPSDVEALATMARVRYAQEDWPGMLAAAEMGLAVDPESTRCNNLRAMALVKLGRSAEAGQTLDAALARDPENAFTHANRGWSLLESGQQTKALDHFREALTFDPSMEWSRAGIVESLKARNFIYRWLLRYFLFMAKLSSRTRWGVVVGGFVLQQILISYADDHPAAAPYCLPVIILYGAFALLTWLGQPLFNLLLFFDKLGRRALSSDQRAQAISVGGVLLASVALAATAFFGSGELNFLGYYSAVSVAMVSIPTCAIYVCKPGWPRRTMVLAAAALALIAVLPAGVWLYVTLWPQAPANPATTALGLWKDLFVPGIIGSQFLAIYLSRITPVR